MIFLEIYSPLRAQRYVWNNQRARVKLFSKNQKFKKSFHFPVWSVSLHFLATGDSRGGKAFYFYLHFTDFRAWLCARLPVEFADPITKYAGQSNLHRHTCDFSAPPRPPPPRTEIKTYRFEHSKFCFYFIVFQAT